MNVDEFLESDFVTLAWAEEKSGKTGVILNSGEKDTFDGKKGFKLHIELDGEQRFWRLNRHTIQAFVDAWGNESRKWIGQTFKISTGKVNKKDAIIGKPGVKIP